MPQDGLNHHQMTLELIEQVAALRGQVRAMEVEWDAIRAQIQKGWQRIEKANERAERRLDDGAPPPEQDPGPREGEATLTGFAKKLATLKGA